MRWFLCFEYIRIVNIQRVEFTATLWKTERGHLVRMSAQREHLLSNSSRKIGADSARWRTGCPRSTWILSESAQRHLCRSLQPIVRRIIRGRTDHVQRVGVP